MTIHNIKFSTPAEYITTICPNVMSPNGPYIAAHLGRINSDHKSGQVYYLRPYSTYDKKTKRLIITMDESQETVHQNDNKLSNDLVFSGSIIIDNFAYDKHNINSIIYVDMKVKNNTGKPLRGVQIHNGFLRDQEFTAYGRIVYFLFSTKYWIEKKRKYHKQVPVRKILPLNNLIVKLSEN